jgi:predicted Zn-dependent protease with MMP-like domain
MGAHPAPPGARTPESIAAGAAREAGRQTVAVDTRPLEIGTAEFDDLVVEALDTLPPRLAALVDNVVVLVEDEPPPDDPHLLGLYDGIPLTERDSSYTFVPPDRILIFRGPLTRMCRDREELVEEVRITVVHEIAHHFGIDDAQLHAWGWG